MLPSAASDQLCKYLSRVNECSFQTCHFLTLVLSCLDCCSSLLCGLRDRILYQQSPAHSQHCRSTCHTKKKNPNKSFHANPLLWSLRWPPLSNSTLQSTPSASKASMAFHLYTSVTVSVCALRPPYNRRY